MPVGVGFGRFGPTRHAATVEPAGASPSQMECTGASKPHAGAKKGDGGKKCCMIFDQHYVLLWHCCLEFDSM